MSANATDRADAGFTEGLVRSTSQLDAAALERQLHLHPCLSAHSHHAHFDLPPTPRKEGSGSGSDTAHSARPKSIVDIEHVPVDDDPREWSAKKKAFVFTLMTVAVLGPMISPSIYNPVIDEIQDDLHASETQVGLSLSMYILLQGVVPVFWASVAEIIGRKIVYIVSFVLYTVGSVVVSLSPTMSVLIGMRCVMAMGSSAVLSVGAGSLADMYEVKDRGRKLGIYYGMPMLGPTLGPLIGGALGNAYGWRSTHYFLAAFAGIMTVAFFFFPDTWRRERSRVYQKAVSDALKRSLKAERRRQRKLAKGLASTATTPATTHANTPWGTHAHTPAATHANTPAVTRPGSVVDGLEGGGFPQYPGSTPEVDVESGERKQRTWPKWLRWLPFAPRPDDGEFHPSLRDVNPLPTMASIWHAPTNAVVLVCSGLLFATQYTITYTASITFAAAPYSYNPLIIGVVLLSFGMGNVTGSVVGGRFSDTVMRRLTAANGGVSTPEMRLRAAMPGMPLAVASCLVYAWTAHYTTNIAGPVVALFFAGFAIVFVYANTLGFLVDANPGRSASAISSNSFTRGVGACIMSQVAMPLKNAIGDGGLYTLFAGFLFLSVSGLTLVAYKGEEWRSPDHHFVWFAAVKGAFGRKTATTSHEVDKREVMSNTTSRTLYASEPSSEKAKADKA